MDINITEEKINNIYAMGDYFGLMVNEKMYEATTVILATGVQYGKLFDGEEKFLGKVWDIVQLVMHLYIKIK